VAAVTHGFVGADLLALTREAALLAMARAGTSTAELRVTLADLRGANFPAAQIPAYPVEPHHLYQLKCIIKFRTSKKSRKTQKRLRWFIRNPTAFGRCTDVGAAFGDARGDGGGA
jgi:SpoVK/Ycf46/Vps4 family AAA+-type ATPase